MSDETNDQQPAPLPEEVAAFAGQADQAAEDYGLLSPEENAIIQTATESTEKLLSRESKIIHVEPEGWEIDSAKVTAIYKEAGDFVDVRTTGPTYHLPREHAAAQELINAVAPELVHLSE